MRFANVENGKLAEGRQAVANRKKSASFRRIRFSVYGQMHNQTLCALITVFPRSFAQEHAEYLTRGAFGESKKAKNKNFL